MLASVPSVRVNEVSLEYQWWGSPSEHPPVLLLHDALGSLKAWGELPARLAEAADCRVYAYSRQGYGGSDPLTGPLPRDYIEREALDVLPRVREALHLEDATLVGLQEGASIALVHAGGGSMATRAVAAITPLLFVDEVTRRGIEALARQYSSSPMRESLSRTGSDQEKTFLQWTRLWTSPAFASWQIDDFVRGVTCPVLAARGDRDEFTSEAQVERLSRLGHDVEVVTLPGCRHMPHLDKPGVLTTTLADFLRKVP